MTSSDIAVNDWRSRAWLGLVIALPASAVIAGLITLWIAIHYADVPLQGLSQKDGKAVVLNEEKLQNSAAMGLRVSIAQQDNSLRFDLQGKETITQFDVHLQHHTLADADQRFHLFTQHPVVPLPDQFRAQQYWIVIEGVGSDGKPWMLHGQLQSPVTELDASQSQL